MSDGKDMQSFQDTVTERRRHAKYYQATRMVLTATFAKQLREIHVSPRLSMRTAGVTNLRSQNS